MRRPTSCMQCRAAKRKCWKQGEVHQCVPCRQSKDECSLAANRRRSNLLLPLPAELPYDQPSPKTGLHKEPLLTDEAVQELVQCYFYYIHDRPHTLFHEATLWNHIETKTIEQSLLYAICGLAASLSSTSELRTLGPSLASHSKRLLLGDLESVCLSHIQACILIANISAAELDPSAEALFFGIANRMAHILRLHVTNENDGAITREIKARVWWTLVMADHWCSNGLGLPRQLQSQNTSVRLPMEEIVFQEMAADAAAPALGDCRPGLWAYMISLVEIFAQIHDHNRRMIEDCIDEVTSNGYVEALDQQLHDWAAALPEHVRLNETNFESFRRVRLGGPFVALHLGYHHYATVLYFQYLDLHRQTTPAITYRERCKHHASSYSRLLAQSREMPSCDAVYATVGHMTVVSSSVLLHTLLFGRDDEVTQARSDLTSNFAALMDLKKFWPSLERTASFHWPKALKVKKN